MTWTHPTGRSPKCVTLVALGPTHHDYSGKALEGNTPEIVWGSDEVWTLNRGVWAVQHDLLWVMDHIQGEAEVFPYYGRKLWHHDRPIITSDNLDGWPAHVHRYPFDEIQTWLARDVAAFHADWWHNSLAYILCYAGWIGVKELRVWGADYHHHKSGRVEDGHPNVAYWAGVMERVGLRVLPVCTSTFLGADQRGWIYGYRDDPRQPAATQRKRFRDLIMPEETADAPVSLDHVEP